MTLEIKNIRIETTLGLIYIDEKDSYFEPSKEKLSISEINFIKILIDNLKIADYSIDRSPEDEITIEDETNPDVETKIEKTKTEPKTKNKSNLKTYDELTKEIDDREKTNKTSLTDNQKAILKLTNYLHQKNNRNNIKHSTILTNSQKKNIDMMSFGNDLYLLVKNGYIIKLPQDKYRPSGKE